jgi:SAM-dependent methyltransferase
MLDPNSAFAEAAHTLKRHEISLEAILPYVRHGDRVLDIGTYTGHFLALMRRALPTIQAIGIDPDPFAVELGRKRNDIELIEGTIFDDLEIGSFDMTIVSHVLEHVVDLRAFLDRVLRYVADGGRVYIEVPDASRFRIATERDDLKALGMSEPYFQFNFEHINYFTPASIENLMRRNGFVPVSVRQLDSALPVIASTWEPCRIPRATDTDASLRRYIAESDVVSEGVERTLKDLERKGLEVAVWGAGAHTQRLLGGGYLRPERVKFFVDSNREFWNATLAGRPVHSPEMLRGFPELPVVISSFSAERDIERTMQSAGFANEAILLYARP